MLRETELHDCQRDEPRNALAKAFRFSIAALIIWTALFIWLGLSLMAAEADTFVIPGIGLILGLVIIIGVTLGIGMYVLAWLLPSLVLAIVAVAAARGLPSVRSPNRANISLRNEIGGVSARATPTTHGSA